jgi:hypothetical protein
MSSEIGAGYGTWAARMRGERPLILEPVSCLTSSYQQNDWVATLQDNKSIFRLPGQQEKANDNCGKWLRALSCPDFKQMTLENVPHDRYVVKHTCYGSDCPICYDSWASRAASRANDRILQAIDLYRKAGYKIETTTGRYLIGRIDHVVFSPPQDQAKELIRTLGGARTLRSKAVGVMKNAGMAGAALIFHPFRQNDSREPNFNPNMPEGVWYESPHFHAVGCGYLHKSDDVYEATGWAYKKMERRESIQGTLKYTLTHCGIADGWLALTYFGLFSNNKVVIDTIEKTIEPVKCKACGKDLLEYSIIEKDGIEDACWEDKPLGVYTHTVVKKTYKLRDKMKWVWVYNPATCGYDQIKK